MKNLTLKAVGLVALFYAAVASAAGSSGAPGSAPNLNTPTTTSSSNLGSTATSSGATAPYGTNSYNSLPSVTTSPNSYFGSAGYGTGMGGEGMTGPGGAVGTTTNPNYGVSSGTTMSAPGSAPYNAGDAASYTNPSATAPVYREPLYGSPNNNPNSLGTSVTSPPSGTSTNLGY